MKSVLLIEDNHDMRRNIAMILQMEDYAVTACADGRAGLAQARASRPDIILCDVMMPALDGYGVLAEVRGDPGLADVPFIFLTARSLKNASCDTGFSADGHLTKPVRATDLLAAIESQLARSHTGTPREPPSGLQRTRSAGTSRPCSA